jgi:hypothetical protein
MNNKFDELAKTLAQSTTRRQALKRFGLGLAGMTLACCELASKAQAASRDESCYKKCLRNCEENGGTQCALGCSLMCHPF